MSLLGPAGIQRRMAELQARIGTVAPSMPRSTPSPSVSNTNSGEFQNALSGNLSGSIGGVGGTAPFDPMAQGQVTSTSPAEMKSLAVRAAQKFGLDPGLFSALVEQESGWNPAAQSNKGALGLTQLMPATAKDLGVQNPLDPQQNLEGGAKYLRQLLNRFGDDPRLALAAYNAGARRVELAGGVPNIPETVAYVSGIMKKSGLG